MHEWINACLPDVPARIPEIDEEEDDDMATLYFANVYIGTVLVVRYCQNKAHFASDSLSTIAIVREALSKESNKRKIRLNAVADVNDGTVPAFLSLLHPKSSTRFLSPQRWALLRPLAK